MRFIVGSTVGQHDLRPSTRSRVIAAADDAVAAGIGGIAADLAGAAGAEVEPEGKAGIERRFLNALAEYGGADDHQA